MDKNSKSVTSLFIVLALLALAALALSVGRQNQGGADAELLPGFSGQLAKVTAARIIGPADTLIADIRSSGDTWVMANADNYPADISQLRSLLTSLGEARIIETTTAIADNYARIGVADISAEDASGVRIELDGPENPLALIIGNTSSGNTTFVRQAGAAQSYRVSGNLSPARETADWLDRDVINIPANDVLSVRIEHADGETLSIEKSGTGYILAEQPADRALTSPTVLNSVAGALAAVRFDAVRSAALLNESKASTVATITVTVVDGMQLAITAYNVDDETWFSFAPDYDAELVTAAAAQAEVGSEPDATSATANRIDRIKDRVSGWAYRIPTYKADWLLKRTDDLLQAMP